MEEALRTAAAVGLGGWLTKGLGNDGCSCGLSIGGGWLAKGLGNDGWLSQGRGLGNDGGGGGLGIGGGWLAKGLSQGRGLGNGGGDAEGGGGHTKSGGGGLGDGSEFSLCVGPGSCWKREWLWLVVDSV